MKIVHLSSSVMGGAGIAALRLHQSLMKQPEVESILVQRLPVEGDFSIKNNIITAHTDRNIITRIRKKYNIHTERYHWLALDKYPKNYEIATFPTTSYRLDKLPIVREADIIHLHWVAEFLDYPTFFRNIKKPIVWTLHDINPLRGLFHFDSDKEINKENFGELDEKVFQTKIKSINQNEDISVVCLSEWMKQKSLSSPTLGSYPHYIIPNGLDFSSYAEIDRKQSKKNAYVDNSLKTILVVGASLENKQKGFPILFDAINKLERSDFNLISIGHLESSSVIRENVNHIHFNKIEDIEHLNTLYSAADITVIPSREDNLPNVMLESFSNGTPIMSFSNGGMAEHTNEGKNGVLIKEIGVESLMLGLNDFLDNKYTFDNQIIRNYAITHFSNELQVKEYLKLYNNILNK